MKLKDIIEKIMIPESKAFLNELDEIIKNNSSSEDDLEAKKDMEYFLEELQTILKIINNNQLNDKEAEEIYEKIGSKTRSNQCCFDFIDTCFPHFRMNHGRKCF